MIIYMHATEQVGNNNDANIKRVIESFLFVLILLFFAYYVNQMSYRVYDFKFTITIARPVYGYILYNIIKNYDVAE